MRTYRVLFFKIGLDIMRVEVETTRERALGHFTQSRRMGKDGIRANCWWTDGDLAGTAHNRTARKPPEEDERLFGGVSSKGWHMNMWNKRYLSKLEGRQLDGG